MVKVILAHSHAMIREALRPHLEQVAAAVEVREATSFAQVLAHLADTPDTDLVVLVPPLPDFPGPPAARGLSMTHPRVKLAVVGTETCEHDCLSYFEAGVAAVVPYRMSCDALVSSLRLALAGERFAPADLIAAGHGLGPVHANDAGANLTVREGEVLDLLGNGLRNKMIADRLGISEATVKTHLNSAFRKLGARNRREVVRLLGISSPRMAAK
ncbi:MAG: LuxR C-terminal-related transcriptional regulator [Solirubrobacterales bacterium]